MISKTYNKYIWLLDTLIRENGMTKEDICARWGETMGKGRPMSQRTFHDHCRAVEDLFGIKIVCNVSNGYKYCVSNLDVLRNDKLRGWLIKSFSLSNMIIAGHNMKDRILFENVPHGTEYLKTVIEAMQKSWELIVDYQRFKDSRKTLTIQPYAMKVYRQRWYVLAYIKESDAVRSIAFDRVLEMSTTKQKFSPPKGFSAEKYYANNIGIFVDEDRKPQKVRIRVYGRQVDYLRTLPLHPTQEEVLTRHQEYSDFQYRVCLTPELSTHLLAMGADVEVLEPQELREEIIRELEKCLNKYK